MTTRGRAGGTEGLALGLLPRRALLALSAVADVAVHARPHPVAAKALAERHGLPPRHLETLLQALVRAGILKGVRGPRGGYELARERRRISAAEVVRASLDPSGEAAFPASRCIEALIAPIVTRAGAVLLADLEKISVENLCHAVDPSGAGRQVDFTI